MIGEDERGTRVCHSPVGIVSGPSVIVDVFAVECMDVAREVSSKVCENNFKARKTAATGMMRENLPKQCEKDVNHQVRAAAANHEDSNWRNCCLEKEDECYQHTVLPWDLYRTKLTEKGKDNED